MVRPRSVWLLIAGWSVPALLTAMQAWLDADVKDVGLAVIREGVPPMPSSAWPAQPRHAGGERCWLAC